MPWTSLRMRPNCGAGSGRIGERVPVNDEEMGDAPSAMVKQIRETVCPWTDKFLAADGGQRCHLAGSVPIGAFWAFSQRVDLIVVGDIMARWGALSWKRGRTTAA